MAWAHLYLTNTVNTTAVMCIRSSRQPGDEPALSNTPFKHRKWLCLPRLLSFNLHQGFSTRWSQGPAPFEQRNWWLLAEQSDYEDKKNASLKTLIIMDPAHLDQLDQSNTKVPQRAGLMICKESGMNSHYQDHKAVNTDPEGSTNHIASNPIMKPAFPIPRVMKTFT